MTVKKQRQRGRTVPRAAPERQKPARRTPSRPAARATSAAPRADGAAPTLIVGVGASAGGLEAFSAVLRGLGANTGAAVVFVQHLAPKHESALVALLSSQSELPVVQATDGMRVERNHVYVIPPNAQMSIVDGVTARRCPPDGPVTVHAG